MEVISWNVRKGFYSQVKDLISKHSSDIIGNQINSTRVTKIIKRSIPQKLYEIPPEGSCGGISLISEHNVEFRLIF